VSEGKKKGNTWYKATERMLYTYKSFPIRVMALMQQIEMVRQQLEPSIIASYEPHQGKSYSVSSPVETAAINRIEGDTIRKLELKIKNLETLKGIVEVSIDTVLDQEQRQLVKLIYEQKMPWQAIIQDLHIDKNTYYQKKNDIVKLLAWCFGYLPDDEAEDVLGLFMDQALWQEKKVGYSQSLLIMRHKGVMK
jgi:hypothetical protein